MARIRRLITGLGIALLVTACGDSMAPLFDQHFAGNEPPLISQPTSPPTAPITIVAPQGTVKRQLTAPLLETYHASFTAVQGRKATHTIHHTNGVGFLTLEIPASAKLVSEAGRPLARGESVEITVDIDPASYAVRLQPHGIVFQFQPARLGFGMIYADWAGHTDEDDLAVWYQPWEGESWVQLPNEVEFDEEHNWAWTTLDHFSNYAVAW